MDQSRTYSVELTKQSCDCPDWPRVQLCKHVAAVAYYFGNINEVVATVNAVPRSIEPEPEDPRDADADAATPKTAQPTGGPDAGSDASAASILENVISISRAFLSDRVPSSPGTVRSLHVVESHLTAVVRHTRSSESPLPDKEAIPPNQHNTWAETAERMGAQ